jgi:predicted nucleic acid-binding protein
VIVADTSIWVEADRRPVGVLPDALRSLIDADELALALPVRLELTSGLRRENRGIFLRRLSGLPIAVPTENTWAIVERWIPIAADKGHRFAVTDLLIAALADEVGALVWSLDDDFDRMARLGMVGLYSPESEPGPLPTYSSAL